MATVDITEYQNVAHDGIGNRVAAGIEPSRSIQQVPVSGVSAQSGPMLDTTKFVRVHTDSTIRIAFGADPTASGASQRMVGNSTEYFGVTPGIKIAVIASV
jgi:hypothetical protein